MSSLSHSRIFTSHIKIMIRWREISERFETRLCTQILPACFIFLPFPRSLNAKWSDKLITLRNSDFLSQLIILSHCISRLHSTSSPKQLKLGNFSLSRFLPFGGARRLDLVACWLVIKKEKKASRLLNGKKMLIFYATSTLLCSLKASVDTRFCLVINNKWLNGWAAGLASKTRENRYFEQYVTLGKATQFKLKSLSSKTITFVMHGLKIY